MTDIWFYTRGGRQVDVPVSGPELRQLASKGLLKPTDLVWREGMPQWVRAATAPDLFGDMPNGAVMATGGAAADATRRSNASRDPLASATRSGMRQQPRTGMGAGAKVAIIMGVTLALGGLAVAAVLLKINSQDDKKIEPRPPDEVFPKVVHTYKAGIVDKERRPVDLKAGYRYEITAKNPKNVIFDIYLDDPLGHEVAKQIAAPGVAKIAYTAAADGAHAIEIVNMALVNADFEVEVVAVGREAEPKAGEVAETYKAFVRELAEDRHFVNLKASLKYEISATSARGCKLEIYVDDEAGREQARAVGMMGSGKLSFTPAASGRYRIEVVNSGPGDSDFTVEVRSAGRDGGAKGLVRDHTAPGVVDSYKAFVKDLGDDKRFVDVKAGIRYEVTAKSDKFCKMDLFVDDEKGREVTQAQNQAGSAKVSFTAGVTGRFALEVVNKGAGDSNFDVEVRSLGRDGGAVIDVPKVGDHARPGTIERYNPFVRELAEDRRGVDLQAGIRYEVTAKSDKFCKTDLFVDEDGGRQVASQAGAAGTAKATFVAGRTGRFFVEVVNQGAGDSNYDVEVRSLGRDGLPPPIFVPKDKIDFPKDFFPKDKIDFPKDLFPKDKPFDGPKEKGFDPPFKRDVMKVDLPAGKAVTATRAGTKMEEALTEADVIDPVRDAHCKIYALNVVPGKVYTIDMIAGYDTYLRLIDATGREITYDDDGGEGLNARITYRPGAAASLRIVATAYRRTTGPFTLIVRED
ncbi:MAG: GYF domain-containing protein [Gemmataceae bacterium]